MTPGTSRPAARRYLIVAAALLLGALGCGDSNPEASSDGPLDLVIRGGTVYDGSGGAPVRADVGIRGARIAAVGDLADAEGARTVDASGLAVTPGFINTHSWATGSLLADGRGMSDLNQGITTEVFGEGVTLGPLNDRLRTFFSEERDRDYPPPGYEITWRSLSGYLRHMEEKGITPNVASFVGATTLRMYAVGSEDRAATAAELDTMRALVGAEMEEGALGVGSRLAYAPASYASTAELTALAAAASPYGGRYISHIRSEGAGLLESVDELLRIARDAEVPATIYHLKAAGRENWSKMDTVIARVEDARREGLDVNATMYTYRAGSTGLDASIPPWAHAGGPDSLRARLRDPDVRARIAADIRAPSGDWENFYRLAGGPENVLLVELQKEELKRFQGRTLAQVAEARSTDPVIALMDLVLEDESLVQSVYFLMSEDNVRKQIQLPWVAFGSDAPAPAAEGAFLESRIHPRAYGTFARLLGRYVRDEGLISLEEAVRRLTSFPADFLGFSDRGRLREGAFADVVVFDPATIRDRATYDDPHQYAAGVEHVWVNGVQVLRDGAHTGEMPGRALRRR